MLSNSRSKNTILKHNLIFFVLIIDTNVHTYFNILIVRLRTQAMEFSLVLDLFYKILGEVQMRALPHQLAPICACKIFGTYPY
jgi:hypothetical protein